MNKFLLFVFVLFTCTFAQKNTSEIQIDSSTTKESNYDQLVGLEIMFSNYVFGVEEDDILGETYGMNFDYKLIYPYLEFFKFNIGLLIINQQSKIGCEHVEAKVPNSNQNVFYFKFENSSYYKHFMYNIGIAFNTESKANTVCHNEIYFHPILISYDIGIGDIDNFYFSFGINNDFEISKSHSTYGLFSVGFNYIVSAKDFIRINYYFNRDNFHHERFYHGWILKSHFKLYKRYGLNNKFYYSNDIKGFCYNLGLTYIL